MEKFKITAINQLNVVLVYVGLFGLFITTIVILAITGSLNVFTVITTLILIVSLYFYLRKHFIYSLTLQLLNDRFSIKTGENIQEVLFQEIESYKADLFNGVRLNVQLKSKKKIRIISTNSFGVDPKNLEEFLDQFKDRIKSFQQDTSFEIKRKNSFLETNYSLFLIIGLSIIGFITIFIELIRGNGFSTTMLVILVPLLILIPAFIKARIKNNNP